HCPVTSPLVSETAVPRGPGLPSSIRPGFLHLAARSGGVIHGIVNNAPSPLRWPVPAETARHGRSKSTPVARSGGDRSPRSLQVHFGGLLRRRPLATVAPSPLRWPAPAETARHGRSKSTPVARSGGDRSPRSLQVHSGGHSGG